MTTASELTMAGDTQPRQLARQTAARRLASGVIYALSALLGILAFVYPFFLPTTVPQPHAQAHGHDAPLVTAALVGLSVVALLVELQGRTLSAKTVALLGVLVSMNSVLRFIENAMPLPGGFSPIFAPIILSAYVFGPRFGYLMGLFTLLVSSLVTGGVGPWLPYQMFTAGWAGLTTGWIGHLVRGGRQPPAQAIGFHRWEMLLLVAVGFLWGLIYGAIMNLYFWPYALGPAEQTWRVSMGVWETVRHYAVFYAVTSFGWDMARAVGNVALILLLGLPTLRVLDRFQRRFHFEVVSHAEPAVARPGGGDA